MTQPLPRKSPPTATSLPAPTYSQVLLPVPLIRVVDTVYPEREETLHCSYSANTSSPVELSHRAVSSEVSGHCLALTTNTPKTQAGCPWAGGRAAWPSVPPPGPKDPSHGDAKRSASPAQPCGPAHLRVKLWNKASHFSPPHHGGRRFGVRPTDPSVAQQRGSAQHPGAHLKELSNQES